MTAPYNIATYLYFGVAGVLCTFYYPYLNQQVNLSLLEVSRVISFGALFSLISQPFLGYRFTKSKNKKQFMLIYLSLILIVNLFLVVVKKNFIYLFAISYGLIILPLLGIYEIYIEKISVQQNFQYSKVRKWGSIGLGSITFLSGAIIYNFGFKALHLLSIIMLILCMIIIFKAFATLNLSQHKEKLNYGKVLKNKTIIIIFLMSFLGLGSYVGIDFAYSPYLTDITKDASVSNQIYSVSTGVKVFLEFVTFTIAGIYLEKVNLKKIFITIFIFTALRFLMLSTGILPIIILGDQLHGIAFPLFLAFVFKYLRSEVEEELVPACYSIVSMLVFGVSNFVFPTLFGAIQNKFGYSLMYLFCSSLSVLSILIGVIFLPKPKEKYL